ncbi:MAG: EAL domain-containing protein, partial [Thalassospira sp.]
KVVAVGVETEEQLAALQAADCDEMQGFLLSHPRDAVDTFELLLRQSTADRKTESKNPAQDEDSG